MIKEKIRNNIPRLPYILGIGLLLTMSSAFGPAASAEDSCVTTKCHSSIISKAVVHPVASSCDSCHEQVSKPHPQKSVKTFKLTQEPPALCATCHAPFGSKKYVHTAVKNGMCTSCHDPHSSAQQKLLVTKPDGICATCHPDKTDFKYMHGPAAAGDCLTCHNPHESDNKAQTLKSGADICFSCHVDLQNVMQKADVHPAMKNGCTSCHNPHGSAFKKFFAAEGNNLCFKCHPKIGEKLKGAAVVHQPIKSESGCASCHSPHASDGEKLLPKSGKDLCLTCHPKVLKKEYTLLHGPIKEGKCTPCHDPHASANSKLLIKGFPTELYMPYTENEYALCFSCHKRDLLLFPETSYATGFRDGERNLHYVHVNKKEKGRSCVSCHSIHGGTLPKLISEKVKFGNWELPIKFEKTENGGRCFPGCHSPYGYDRKSPLKGSQPLPERDKEKAKGKGK
jgi:predicted CXXCH cytochrome family protein